LACVHLFHGTDEFSAALAGWLDEIGSEEFQGQSRSKIEGLGASPQYPLLTLEVALLAYRFPKRMFETPRIDDSVIQAGNVLVFLLVLNV
jgi:hypothetical protein